MNQRQPQQQVIKVRILAHNSPLQFDLRSQISAKALAFVKQFPSVRFLLGFIHAVAMQVVIRKIYQAATRSYHPFSTYLVRMFPARQ